MSPLTYRRFPAERSGDVPSADTAAWARARALGFLEDASPQATVGPARVWAAEGRVLHGLFDDSVDRLEREDTGPVATLATLEGRLDVGHGCDLPTVLVADVAVRMGHEGQGLMRVLIDHVSASAIVGGAAVMALHAAHAAIYERLGYAPATRSARVDVDVARFALREQVAGRVCEVDPSRAADIEGQVRGHGPARLGVLSSSLGAGPPDADVRHIVHEAPNGSPDALLSFRFRGWSAEASVIDVVQDLGRLEGRGALWQSLASTRIATTIHRPETPLDDPLPWLLRDRGAWRVVGVVDGLSLRVLAPARVLGARRYWCPPTRLVIEVTDPTGVAGGRWAVDVDGESAHVDSTDQPADVALGSVELSAALLGGSIVGSPFQTSSVSGSEEAVSSFRTLMSTPWDAHCDAHF